VSNDPIIFLHGFTQTGAVWAPFVEHLAPWLPAEAEIIAPDLPGHGSGSTLRFGLDQSAQYLAEMIGATTTGAGIVIGYSMGGRIALHLAIEHPAAVTRLVLIGANPGISDPTERAARRADDETLAARLEDIGVEAFLEFWLAQPLFAGLSEDRADVEARRANTADGLASSLRLAGVGTQRSLWERLEEITVPTLLISGARDAKFRAIAAEMRDRLPNATEAHIAGAGHAAHLEAPEATARAIGSWLATSG